MLSSPQQTPAPQRDTGYWKLTGALLFVTVFFAIIPSGFEWGVTDPGQTNDTLRKVQWLPLYGLGGWLLWRRRRIALAMLPLINPFLILFCLWALVSVSWAEVVSSSIARNVKLWGTMAIALGCASASWAPTRFEHLTWKTLMFALGVSLIMVFALPEIARHQDDALRGLWNGITASKNQMGFVFSLAMIFTAINYYRGTVRGKTLVLCLALIGVMIVGVQSTTSTLCGLIGTAIVWMVVRPPVDTRGYLGLIIGIAILVIGVPYFVVSLLSAPPTVTQILEPAATAVGKDISLTGRDDIWEYVISEAKQHPIKGMGYGSFWLGPGGPSELIHEALYWIPFQAHNGYIDIVNETGFIGLGLVIAFVLMHLYQIRLVLRIDRIGAAGHLALLIYVLISNIAETTLFLPPTLPFTLLALSSAVMSRVLLQARWQAEAEQASRSLNPRFQRPESGPRQA